MIPKDPAMLLSFVNTQLRDDCSNLSDFCKKYNVSQEEINSKLKVINYFYSKESNQFI